MCIRSFLWEKPWENDFNNENSLNIYPGDKRFEDMGFLNERDTVVRMQTVSDIGKQLF